MRVLDDLLDLILPASCVSCGRPGSLWCIRCQPASVAELVCPAHGPPTYAAGDYGDELRTALLAYKERHRVQLAPILAGYLADAVDSAARAGDRPGAATVLVPVPSRRAAARERGGDHVDRLVRAVSRQLALPIHRILRLTGAVADSAGLTARQRAANLAGRMVALPVAGHTQAQVIVVDDIVTTGTTLAEASRALHAAGWSVSAGAVLAATRLRRADS